MNLAEVIEALVEERGLARDAVITIVQDGVRAAYEKKYPHMAFVVVYDKKSGTATVFVEKLVTDAVRDEDTEISVRKARQLKKGVRVGQTVAVPFDQKIGRIEILAARQVIAGKIKALEQELVFNEYKPKEGTIVSGTVHKHARDGYSVKIGDIIALLPRHNAIPREAPRIGVPIKALLQEVLPVAKGDYQVILDRASADFVQKLIESEIPEVFEGLVEIKRVARIAGYKTKLLVEARSKEIDPVGTCVGVGGSRIKPILRELGEEKIDLIEQTGDLETLVKNSLKPAEVDRVELEAGGKRAVVWLAQDQRSFAIGKMGRNIALASRLTGVEVQLQDVADSGRTEVGLDFPDDKTNE